MATNKLPILLAICCLIARCAPAQAAEGDAVERADDGLKSLRQSNAGLKTVEVKSLRDVVTFSVEDDRLLVHSSFFDASEKVELKIPGRDGLTTLQVLTSDEQQSNLPSMFMLSDYTFDDDNRSLLAMYVIVNSMNTQVVRDTESPVLMENISIVQTHAPNDDTPGVILRVTRTSLLTNEKTVDLQLQADTLVQLRERYPDETSTYLQPIFEQLGQELFLFAPDAARGWQVLADAVQPDLAVMKKVDDLVIALDAPGFRERDSATEQLRELGRPAAIVLLQKPLATMSVEQQTRIGSIVEPYARLSPDEARALRHDAKFLIDCLCSDDADLRVVARRELEQLLGREVEFDMTASAQARFHSARKLRAELTQPTTRP